MASSFDLIFIRGGEVSDIQRRMFPMLRIGPKLLGSTGKTAALLWQVWLLVGPQISSVRRFLSRVTSITTDQGAERLIPGIGDVLPAFYRYVGCSFRQPIVLQEKLFMNALPTPGWNHLLDGLLQTGLNSLRWWPRWIEVLKGLNKALREWKESIVEDLILAGLAGAANLVSIASAPYFAAWRWHTLHACCKSTMSVFDTLKLHRDKLLAQKNTRDQALLRKFKEALHDQAWEDRFRAVAMYTAWVVSLQKWGAGCLCHRDELVAGKSVACNRKGRLVHMAFDHASRHFTSGMEQASAWTPASFNGRQDLQVDVLGLYRRTQATGLLKLDWLECIPWLLAKLPFPGVRDRVLRQWESVPSERHHAISNMWLEQGP